MSLASGIRLFEGSSRKVAAVVELAYDGLYAMLPGGKVGRNGHREDAEL